MMTGTVSQNPGPSAASSPAAIADPQWAWAAYRPDAKCPWTAARVGHLYRRAAFGATAAELQSALEANPQAVVDQLVNPPATLRDYDAVADADDEAVARSGSLDSARAWWLRRMLDTPFPLRERMTLFWHDHFGVQHARVNNIGLMVRHVGMLRRYALGPYRPLLQAAAQDPAVLLGVGADANRKARPNDSFARQLMERFSVGPGNFGEEDVREAARAFTGWFVLRGRVRFLEREHDAGSKRVLGQSGQWRAQDVVKLVLDQPATPRQLVRKLYRWLISETAEPDSELLDPLVESMGNGRDVGRVVETMLRSNLFFSDAAYRQRVKGPVEFAVGMIRAVEANVSTQRLGADLARLGQNLYNPATAAGWPSGTGWLSPVTMIERANLAQALWQAKGPYGGKLNPQTLAEKYHMRGTDATAEFFVRLFLQDDLPPASRKAALSGTGESGPRGAADQSLRQVAYRLVTLPEFQLS